MKKFLSIALALLPLQLMAQLGQFGLVSSSNQQIIEDAIEGAFYVVVQQYQLQDTVSGGYFGRGGRQEFGTTVSLGVKVSGGYLYLDPAERPWEYDSNFERYRQSHRPVLYKTLFRELTDSLGTEVANFRARQAQTWVPDRLYHVTDFGFFDGAGLCVEGEAGTKEGWLVWVTSPQQDAPQAEGQDAVSYVIYRKTMTLTADTPVYSLDKPNTQNKVWGGIYVSPVRTAMGQITFELEGVMVKQGEDWVLLALTGQAQPAAPAEGAPQGASPSQEQGGLTPAGAEPTDGDPALAPAASDSELTPDQTAEGEDEEQTEGKKKKGKKKKNQ